MTGKESEKIESEVHSITESYFFKPVSEAIVKSMEHSDAEETGVIGCPPCPGKVPGQAFIDKAASCRSP